MDDGVLRISMSRSVGELRSVDLLKKGCVKSRAFLLRLDASSPPPSVRVRAPFFSTNTSIFLVGRRSDLQWALDGSISNSQIEIRHVYSATKHS